MKKTKTFVIGGDAADWKSLNLTIDQGLMPNLDKLVGYRVMDKLFTFILSLPPSLWMSITTVKFRLPVFMAVNVKGWDFHESNRP